MGKRKNKLTDLSEFSNNRIVLLFSGGYDSTAILVNLIQSGCRDITCVYIDIPNNKDKSKIEQYRCKKILKQIKKSFKIKIPLKVYTSMNLDSNDCHISFGQPFLFITTLTPYLDENVDYIFMGFHRSSSIWNCYSQVEDAFKSLNAILRCRRYNNMGGYSNIFLYNPYEFYDKSSILKYLKKYKKIYKLCWTCENPTKKGKPCGKCIPCKKYKEAKK